MLQLQTILQTFAMTNFYLFLFEPISLLLRIFFQLLITTHHISITLKKG